MDTSHFTAWNWAGIVVQMIIGFMFGYCAPFFWMAAHIFVLLLWASPLLFLFFFGPALIGALLSYVFPFGLSNHATAIKPDAPDRTKTDLRRARLSSFAAFLIAGLTISLRRYWWPA
jgi:hypothetical protein